MFVNMLFFLLAEYKTRDDEPMISPSICCRPWATQIFEATWDLMHNFAFVRLPQTFCRGMRMFAVSLSRVKSGNTCLLLVSLKGGETAKRALHSQKKKSRERVTSSHLRWILPEMGPHLYSVLTRQTKTIFLRLFPAYSLVELFRSCISLIHTTQK